MWLCLGLFLARLLPQPLGAQGAAPVLLGSGLQGLGGSLRKARASEALSSCTGHAGWKAGPPRGRKGPRPRRLQTPCRDSAPRVWDNEGWFSAKSLVGNKKLVENGVDERRLEALVALDIIVRSTNRFR